MTFTVDNILKEDDIQDINNFFVSFDEEENIFEHKTHEEEKESTVTKYVNSLVTSCYAKSVEDIANTTVGSKIKRKRNLQQIMQESCFYGANRFGKNFIA
jgi:hypothetical protein